MTTIAYSRALGVMAGDKMASTGDSKHGRVTKVFKIKGSLIGFSGSLDVGVAILRWFENDCNEDYWPELQYESLECNVLVVGPDGVVRVYERYPVPIVMEQNIHAIGSGRDFALAAMHLGFDPVKAVEVASELDGCTGGGVDVVYLNATESH
jgi:ATP-dependent protease HslVU (ClpYQ) peptidase subunit